jgi:alkylation response protein AidB-like acyl-CoA dehydrogenase
MTFSVSQEQREFQDTIRSFFGQHVSSDKLRALLTQRESARAEATKASDTLWEALDTLGVREAFSCFDEAERTPFTFLASLATESGRALLPLGYWQDLFAGTYVWHALLSAETRVEVSTALPAWTSVVNGESRVTIVAPVISGETTSRLLIPWTPEATAALVLRAKGTILEASLAILNPSDLIPAVTVDGTVTASYIEASRCSFLALSPAISRNVAAAVSTLVASEVCGALTKVVEMTCEFVTQREQFGVPIGGFQAVQQRLAQMHVEAESAAALTRFAAWSIAQGSSQALMAGSAALSRSLEVGPRTIEGAIQLHGGMGFTYEYDLHLYLRRVKLLEALWAQPGAFSSVLLSEATALA